MSPLQDTCRSLQTRHQGGTIRPENKISDSFKPNLIFVLNHSFELQLTLDESPSSTQHKAERFPWSQLCSAGWSLTEQCGPDALMNHTDTAVQVWRAVSDDPCHHVSITKFLCAEHRLGGGGGGWPCIDAPPHSVLINWVMWAGAGSRMGGMGLLWKFKMIFNRDPLVKHPMPLSLAFSTQLSS